MSCSQYTGQAYDCCIAVQKFNETLNNYHTQLETDAQNQASWDRWNSAHTDWSNKQGAYSHWQNTYSSLQNETRWSSCGTWVYSGCSASTSCDAGWDKTGVHQNCGFLNAGCQDQCKRSGSQLASDWQQSGYFQDEPKTDPQDSSKTWINTSRPPLSSLNIQSQIVCCSQSFDNLTAKNTINISDITQKCSATMSTPTSTPTSAPIITPASTSTPTNTSTTTTTKSNDNIIIIILIILSLIVLLSSS
jgi:hypothetical protein